MAIDCPMLFSSSSTKRLLDDVLSTTSVPTEEARSRDREMLGVPKECCGGEAATSSLQETGLLLGWNESCVLVYPILDSTVERIGVCGFGDVMAEFTLPSGGAVFETEADGF